MGKNKKNKNQNRVNLDSSDDESKTDYNKSQTETTTSPSYNENKKKNVFNKLIMQDEEQDNQDENYCNECGRECDGVHAFVKQVKSIQEVHLIKQNSDKYDKYFSQAYHEDDYQHDYTKAIELYEQSLIHDDITYHGVAAHNMGLLYKEKFNDLINAEKYYKIACENNYKDSFINLGLIYYNQNKYIDAEKYFAKAVTYGKISIYKEYAHTLEQLDKKEDAFKYLQYHLMLKNANNSEKKMFSRLIKQID